MYFDQGRTFMKTPESIRHLFPIGIAMARKKHTAKPKENHEQWETSVDNMARNRRHRAARTRPREPQKAKMGDTSRQSGTKRKPSNRSKSHTTSCLANSKEPWYSTVTIHVSSFLWSLTAYGTLPWL